MPASVALSTRSYDTPTVARYSLSGQFPKLTDILPLAERINAALVELSDGSSPCLKRRGLIEALSLWIGHIKVNSIFQ